MSQPAQTYKTHVRWQAPYHFVVAPILALHVFYTFWKVYQEPTFDRIEQLVLAIGIFLVGGLTRINALRVQDRLIRLEEKLRYQRVLPADLAVRAEALPVRFIIALRFASDEELAGLVTQALDGRFDKPVEIKKAIQNWRGDYLRV